MSGLELTPRSVQDPHRPPEDEISVESAGVTITGWKSVSIVRRMDSASGAFTLSIAHSQPWPLRPGAEVKIRVGTTLVVTGFVDDIRAEFDAQSRGIEISGRDATEDLVDCSVPESPMELRNVVLSHIVHHCADPLGVEVDESRIRSGPADERNALFEVFRFNPGESAWTALERACRMRGVLAYADERGRLVLNVAGSSGMATALEYGKDQIKRGELSWTHAERFRVYVVQGQRPGDARGWERVVAQIRSEARDLEISRGRILVQGVDAPVDQATCDTYAQWLATHRAARSATITLEVFGWRQSPGGPLWQPNLLVPVTIPLWQVAGEEFLINAVEFSYPPRLAKIELVRKNAYAREPELGADFLLEWGTPSTATADTDVEGLDQ